MLNIAVDNELKYTRDTYRLYTLVHNSTVEYHRYFNLLLMVKCTNQLNIRLCWQIFKIHHGWGKAPVFMGCLPLRSCDFMGFSQEIGDVI